MIRGVVLCGGESKRMGRDKGMLAIGDLTWAEHAAKKLNGLNIPVVVSIKEKQLNAYDRVFDPTVLKVPTTLVVDQVEVKGPLTGLMSVHLVYPDDDLLLLACDMTEMDVPTLLVLKDCAIAFPEFDCYSYVNEDGLLEPLCALYTSTMLKKLGRDLQDDELSNFSLRCLIRQASCKTILINDHRSFNNHNSL